MITAELSLEQLRTAWLERQGLTARIDGGVAGAVRTAGWMHSAGSAGPYVSLRARLGLGRAAVDRAVFQERQVLEVPTGRGTMLVPAEDAPLALHMARRFFARHFQKLTVACRISERELQTLAGAVLAIVRQGRQELTPEELRDHLPRDFVRDLGDAGRKLGEASTLSAALRRLQIDGKILRVASARRLDTARYGYVPFEGAPVDPGSALRELAARFFRWAAPATLKEFAWWATLSQREAKEAAGPLGLVPVKVAGRGEALLFEDEVPRLGARRVPDRDAVLLLPFRDNYLHFRRGLEVFLAPRERDARVRDWRNRPAKAAEEESLHHHAIIAGGRLAGVWEYDPGEGRVVYGLFGALTAAGQRKLAARAGELEDFIRADLGDLKFYSMDTERNRKQRIEALHESGGRTA
jgi:hypothetical protein